MRINVWDVGLFLRCCVLVNILTDGEFHGTTFCSDESNRRMKWSENAIPSIISSARCGAKPIHIQMEKLPRRRCKSINLFSWTCFLVAVRNLGSEWRFTCFLQVDVNNNAVKVNTYISIKKTGSIVHCNEGNSVRQVQFVRWLDCEEELGFRHWKFLGFRQQNAFQKFFYIVATGIGEYGGNKNVSRCTASSGFLSLSPLGSSGSLSTDNRTVSYPVSNLLEQFSLEH